MYTVCLSFVWSFRWAQTNSSHGPEKSSHVTAIEKLNWYVMRWKIEVFHKILKSGCKAEESKLRSSERLVNLISIFCIIGWRIFWLTMLHRAEPDLSPAVALDTTEVYLLDELVKTQPGKSHPKATVSDWRSVIASDKSARDGGFALEFVKLIKEQTAQA